MVQFRARPRVAMVVLAVSLGVGAALAGDVTESAAAHSVLSTTWASSVAASKGHSADGARASGDEHEAYLALAAASALTIAIGVGAVVGMQRRPRRQG